MSHHRWIWWVYYNHLKSFNLGCLELKVTKLKPIRCSEESRINKLDRNVTQDKLIDIRVDDTTQFRIKCSTFCHVPAALNLSECLIDSVIIAHTSLKSSNDWSFTTLKNSLFCDRLPLPFQIWRCQADGCFSWVRNMFKCINRTPNLTRLVQSAVIRFRPNKDFRYKLSVEYRKFWLKQLFLDHSVG